MAFAQADRTATLADINITPLVDVMLVLLIIFMVATPMLSRALPLDLPQPIDDRDPPPPPKYTATLHIDAAGTLRWDGQPMSAFAIDALMRIEAGRDEMPLLQIAVEPEADYAHVAAALGRARAAGLTRIALPEG